MSIQTQNFPKIDLELLIKDLNINLEYLKSLTDKYDLSVVARILGHNTDNYDNQKLAGRIASVLIKQKLGTSLKAYLQRMSKHLTEEIKNFYNENLDYLQNLLDSRELLGDLEYDWFSINCLLKNYLTKVNYESEEVIETPFQLYLRIAIAQYYNYGDLSDEYCAERIKEEFQQLADKYENKPAGSILVDPEYSNEMNILTRSIMNKYFDKDGNDLPQFGDLQEKLKHIKETFLDLSNQYYSTSSPIAYNSGLIKGQLASCFLVSIEDDTNSIM